MLVLPNPDGRAARGLATGGQVTAAEGIIQYCRKVGLSFAIVDTSRRTRGGLWYRFAIGVARFYRFIVSAARRNVAGIVIFSSAGMSFIERSMMAFVGARILGKSTLLFLRSGHLLNELDRSGVWITIVRLGLSAPTVVGVQGEKWRNALIRIGVRASKISVIPNWLPWEDEVISGVPSAARCGIAFVGTVSDQKGVGDLLAAITESELLQKSPVRIVGDGPTLGKIEARLVVDPRLKHVRCYGQVNRARVRELLRESEVFVLPSYAEGFPNAVLEAVLEGAAVVASNVGAIPDTIRHEQDGLLVSPGDVTELKGALERMLGEPEFATSCRRSALERIRLRHSLNVNCAAVLAAVGLSG